MPPYPQDTGFTEIYSDEEGARRAAHRGRQIFLAWMCLVAAAIAASAHFGERSPPVWFQILATAEKPFPPLWLDNIQRSAFLTCFRSSVPRRGLVVNMSVEWSFWSCFRWFEAAGVPVWMCFPHGEKCNHRLATALYPSAASIETARLSALSKEPILHWIVAQILGFIKVSGLWPSATNGIWTLTAGEVIDDVDVAFSEPTTTLTIDDNDADEPMIGPPEPMHVEVEGIANILTYRYGVRCATAVGSGHQNGVAYTPTTDVRNLLRAMVEEEAIGDWGSLSPQLADVARTTGS
ncbi:hypothetical protein QCA50_010743 [Cerrena zonata]|uniref:Uncharacterized protein n=1 Tax=Cerrena zonata TaxID=2478898 RepID=A0AAW0G2N3_9APHY